MAHSSAPNGPASPDEDPSATSPSLVRLIGEAVVLLSLAGACFVGVLLSGHLDVEGWHLEHTAIRGLVTHVGTCERDEEVLCPGRFAALDGRIVDRPVTLQSGRSDPTEPVPARLAAFGYTHVWADDAPSPSVRGGHGRVRSCRR